MPAPRTSRAGCRRFAPVRRSARDARAPGTPGPRAASSATIGPTRSAGGGSSRDRRGCRPVPRAAGRQRRAVARVAVAQQRDDPLPRWRETRAASPPFFQARSSRLNWRTPISNRSAASHWLIWLSAYRRTVCEQSRSFALIDTTSPAIRPPPREHGKRRHSNWARRGHSYWAGIIPGRRTHVTAGDRRRKG